MKFNKITQQFLIIIFLPIIAVIAGLVFYINSSHNQTFEEAKQGRIQLLNEEIRQLHHFKLRTLNAIENEVNSKYTKQIKSLTNEIEIRPTRLEDIDLAAVREQMGIDMASQEVYVINSNGVVSNTTDAESYLQNFDNLSFTPDNQFLELIGNNKVVTKPFTIERSSGKLRKLVFNTSARGDFLVMLKNYSPQAQTIMDYLKSNVQDLIIKHKDIKNIHLYINPQNPHFLYNQEAVGVERTTVLRSVFENNTKNLEFPFSNEDNLQRIYTYNEYGQPAVFNKYIVELIFDQEVMKTAYLPYIRNSIVAILVATLIISSLLFFFVRRYVASPVSLMKTSLQKLASGNISEDSKLHYYKKNEFGALSGLYNQVLYELNDLSNFIQELTKGNLKVEFKQEVTEDDLLANHMLQLRDNIKKLEGERLERRKEDKISDWMNEGIQHFNQIMQGTGNEINELSSQVLKNLVQYINAQQGAIYIRTNMDKVNAPLSQTATFAYNQLVTVKKQIGMREGLVGMVAAEKEKIYRTEIPDDYSFISTGLGRTPPKSLLFVPMKIEEQLLGVVEVASLHKMEQYHIEFVEQIASNVAHNIMTAKNNEKNERLLEQFAQQSEEFQNQEEELKKRIEELKHDASQKEEKINALRNDINQLSDKLAQARGRINELKHARKQ